MAAWGTSWSMSWGEAFGPITIYVTPPTAIILAGDEGLTFLDVADGRTFLDVNMGDPPE